MSVIQFFILLVVLVVWWRLYGRLRAGELTTAGFIEWFLLWLAVGLVGLWPEAASYLATLVGVGRGSDLVVYLALLLLFYLSFKVFVRLEQFNRTLTSVVRSLALKEVKQKSAHPPKDSPPVT